MDDLTRKRLENEAGILAMIRASFDAADERKDTAYYLKPDTARVLLEMAERGYWHAHSEATRDYTKA